MKRAIVILAGSVTILVAAFFGAYFFMSKVAKPAAPSSQTSVSLKEVKDIDKLTNEYAELGKSLPQYEKINSIGSLDKIYSYQPKDTSYRVAIELPQLGAYAKKDKTDGNITDITSKIKDLFTSRGFIESSLKEPSGKNATLFDSVNIVCKFTSGEPQKETAAYVAVYCANKGEEGPLHKGQKAVEELLNVSSDKSQLLTDNPTISLQQTVEGDKRFITLDFVYSGKLPSRAYFAALGANIEYLGATMHGSYDSDTPVELPSQLKQAASGTKYGDFLKKQLKL